MAFHNRMQRVLADINAGLKPCTTVINASLFKNARCKYSDFMQMLNSTHMLIIGMCVCKCACVWVRACVCVKGHTHRFAIHTLSDRFRVCVWTEEQGGERREAGAIKRQWCRKRGMYHSAWDTHWAGGWSVKGSGADMVQIPIGSVFGQAQAHKLLRQRFRIRE